MKKVEPPKAQHRNRGRRQLRRRSLLPMYLRNHMQRRTALKTRPLLSRKNPRLQNRKISRKTKSAKALKTEHVRMRRVLRKPRKKALREKAILLSAAISCEAPGVDIFESTHPLR